MRKKVFTIIPLALALVITSCGSKEEKKEGEEKKEERTACDCMGLLVDGVKNLDDMSGMTALQEDLDKKYPECKALVEEMRGKYPDAEAAAKECPAVQELMDIMTEKMSAVEIDTNVTEDTNVVEDAE